MKGRHTAWQYDGSNPPERGDQPSEDQENWRLIADVVKKIVLWISVSVCVLFILWAVYFFYTIHQAIDHPEGNFDGWALLGSQRDM